MIGRTKWFPIEVILRVQSLVLCFDSAITFPQNQKLTKEDSECMFIINERVFKSHNYTRNKTSGFVLVKCCILEICALPLQGVPRGSLSCPDDKPTTAEYAPQTAKRKTQPK